MTSLITPTEAREILKHLGGTNTYYTLKGLAETVLTLWPIVEAVSIYDTPLGRKASQLLQEGKA